MPGHFWVVERLMVRMAGLWLMVDVREPERRRRTGSNG